MIKSIVLASGNQGKVHEISQMLEHLDYDVQPQSTYQVTEVPETGLSFVENALIKARNASKQTGLPAIADDSGIAVDALNGAPGIYSARYAGEPSDDLANLNKLIAEVKKIPESKRDAAFVCVMVFVRHHEDPLPIIAEGIWRGTLVTEPVGENGFGYDPIFYLEDKQCTSAQLPSEQKNMISHRGLAMKKLTNLLDQAKV